VPKQVLLIEDEESVAKAIGEVCTSLPDVEVAFARNGAAGLDALQQIAFDLVVLDILLPGGMDGYKVASSMRDAGSKASIVVLSGFVKDPKVQRDLQAKYGVRAVLQKPLVPEDLRAAIASALGVGAARTSTGSMPAISGSAAPAQVGSFQLELSGVPVPALFGELFRAKAEGVLDLGRGNTKKRFYLQRGFFRYATSNVRAETLAGLAQARGVPEAKLNAALQTARDQGLALTDVLVAQRVVSEKDLGVLLVAQTEEVAMTALDWPDGKASFKAGPVQTGPEARANPVMCVLRGLKQRVQPAQARRWLEAQKSAVLERTPEFERELFSIRNLFAGETVTPGVNGRFTLGELLGRAKDPDVQLLHALLACGLARVKGAPPVSLAGGARPATEPGVPAFVARPGTRSVRDYTAEEKTARTQIFAEQARLATATTHYQVLGVQPGAEASAIKSAFLRLARTYHADAYPGLELGDAATVLDDIFKRVTEANRVLGSPEERATYDHVLDAKSRGLPSNVDEVMQAESMFARAESAQKAGRLPDAEKLYREAVALNAGEPNYLLALANAVYRLKGKAGTTEVLDLLDKSIALKHDSPAALLLRGQLLLETGDAKQALELARRITGLQAGYPGAMELLRQAKVASTGPAVPEKSGGFFGKLLGGKGK